MLLLNSCFVSTLWIYSIFVTFDFYGDSKRCIVYSFFCRWLSMKNNSNKTWYSHGTLVRISHNDVRLDDVWLTCCWGCWLVDNVHGIERTRLRNSQSWNGRQNIFDNKVLGVKTEIANSNLFKMCWMFQLHVYLNQMKKNPQM